MTMVNDINNGLDGSETEQWFIERYAELHAEKYDGEEVEQ